MMETLLKGDEENQKIINLIDTKIDFLKKRGVNTQIFEADKIELMAANERLRTKIALAKDDLKKVELVNGNQTNMLHYKANTPQAMSFGKVNNKPMNDEKQKVKKESKPNVDSKSENVDSTEVIDASRLNMRVGRIVEVTRHADADSLFIEKVDVGESKPRQIISGLVKYCTEADLEGRLGVFLLNLKPAKMRGVLSEGMIMCASAPEQGKVEPLTVPADAKPGDRVTVEGYDGTPDDVLNPKKKTFELIKPDLKVNDIGEATYKGARWLLNGQIGAVVAASLTSVQIA